MVLPSEFGLYTARPSLDLDSVDVTDDSDVRSPRTPIYQPTSPFSVSLGPFDPAKLCSSLSAPLIPKPVAPTEKKSSPPPSNPLAWVWQCHLCRSRWPLGVTRRCLVDGHLYCSGDTSQPNLKKKKKGQSCSSEFDYMGWEEWGAWKRAALRTVSNPRIPTGCERCESPSQCRYGPEEKSLMDNQPSSEPMTGLDYTSAAAEEDVARYYSNENVTFESILAKAGATGKSVQSKMTGSYKADKPLKRSKSMDRTSGRLVALSLERRKVKPPPLSPIEEEALQGDGQGFTDLVMPFGRLPKLHQGETEVIAMRPGLGWDEIAADVSISKTTLADELVL